MPELKKPSQKAAEEAVRTLLLWAGEDPDREGLLDTPKRVVKAYTEFYKGYTEDARAILSRTFEESEGYDEIITLKNVPFESHCEHHMVPFTGKVHIGYLPNKRVVGISKLARIVDVFAKRLQIQEKLTAQIAITINEVLQPKGVAVIVEATHQCMTTRGVHKDNVVMQTSKMLGRFRSDERTRNEFMQLIKG